LQQIIEREATGADQVARDRAREAHDRALSLAAGEEPESTPADPLLELRQLYEKRADIERALRIIEDELISLEGDRVRGLPEADRPEWPALTGRRALRALALQRLNRELESYVRRYGGAAPLPGARYQLLGTGTWSGLPTTDEVRQNAEELVRAGILTAKEI